MSSNSKKCQSCGDWSDHVGEIVAKLCRSCATLREIPESAKRGGHLGVGSPAPAQRMSDIEYHGVAGDLQDILENIADNE